MSTTTQAETVKVGTRFRSTIADANALWEVTGKAGNRVWHAEVVNEPAAGPDGRMWDSDYVGAADVFAEQAIVGSLRQAAFFEEHARKQQEAKDALAVGTTVHVQGGFSSPRAFYRGVIVEQDGQKQVRVESVVGDVDPRDMPRRLADGSIRLGVGKEVGQTIGFRTDRVWESPNFHGRHKFPAPVNQSPVDLTLPEPTAEEAAGYARVTLLNSISEAAIAGARSDDPQTALEAIRAMLPDG